MGLTPVLIDAATQRQHIHQKAIHAVQNVFPLQGKDISIEVEDVKVTPQEYSSRQQRDALLRGQTLQEPLRGTLVLKDAEGKVIERRANTTLAQIPFFTPRHTFIVDGNEYTVAHQRRVRPGVYTRVRRNEELEAAFNLGKGENFRINMAPEKGHLFLQYGATHIPLYPVLHQLGISDKELAAQWGKGVVELNRKAFEAKQDQAVNKLYEKVVPAYLQSSGQSMPERIRLIQDSYKHTQLDPSVTERTLGHAYKQVTPQALVQASKKLLDVHRQGIDTDDRDSLSFQSLYGVDDFIKERIELEGRNLRRKVRMKSTKETTLDKLVPSSPFTKSVRSFVTTAALSAIPTQINPMEIIDSAVRVTNLGEGGISSERAVPAEARNMHSTHFGIIDGGRTPETFRAGIDLRTAIWAKRDDHGQMYSLMRNAKTGKLQDVPVRTLENATVAFAGQKQAQGVSALKNGQLVSVARKDVDYELPHPSFLFSPATNTVPFPESMQGNRLMMGSKYATQALPLVEREEPWVQVASYNPKRTFEQELADLIVPRAPVDGVIKKIDDDYIYIQPQHRKKAALPSEWPALAPIEHVAIATDTEPDIKTAAAPLIKVPYDTNFPLSSKTYLHNNLTVKPGDSVETNQHLAGSNYTKNGRLALGRNLTVAYTPYYGLNSNDAVVISESGAKKMTSEHMYKEALALDADTILDKNKHRGQFGMRWTDVQYRQLDSRGIAMVGAIVQPGDPLILALRKTEPSAEQRLLGRLHKTLATPFREESVVWDHRNEGEVVDVVVTDQRALVLVKTRESAGVGDKFSNRYGGKGVISKIIPDDQMLQTSEGKPVDMLVTSTGIISRINPAQILETAVAKVAQKTGKPIAIDSLSGKNNVKWARQLLKEHHLSDKEPLYNPVSGKAVVGPDGKGVMVGPQYIYKLFKSTETNYSARGVEDYDVNLQPAKGGATGAKALGRMEIDALVNHNARNVLREASVLKSTRNDEFWRRYQLGQPLPPLKSSFAFDKFTNMLRGAGINIQKTDSQLKLGPMTDNDITQLSSGALKRPLMVRERDFSPEKGGLFDPVITGGTAGNRWSHVDLSEPIVNPVFEDPTRRLLGLSQAEFRKILAQEGGQGIQKRLKALDLTQKETELRALTQKATGNSLDSAVKQLKAVRALQQTGLTADKAYVLSKLPIVPPIVRPILPSKGKRDMLVSDVNYFYRDAMLANSTLEDAKRLLPEDDVGKARLHLYDATRAAFGLGEAVSPQLKGRGGKGLIATLAGQGSPKRGFFHSKVLKRPQDLSARGTVVPDLTLNMDQVGLPEDMLWVTYGPHIIRRLVSQGYSAVDAKRMLDERHPTARDALMQETQERPVMVNRAPTLHRHGIIGAYPVPVAEKTIRVNPFMEVGMGMDYDGDCVDCYLDISIDCNGQKTYRHLHIKDLPHLQETCQVKKNTEHYEVPEGLRVFSYDETTQDVRLRKITGFSVHHNLNMNEVTLYSGRTVKVSDDASLFALNPDTWQLERVKPSDAVGWATPRPRILQRDTVCTTVRFLDRAQALTQDFGWYFGAFAGKGWIQAGTNTASCKGVGFSSSQKELRQTFYRIVTETLGHYSVREYGYTHVSWDQELRSEKIHINSVVLGQAMVEMGVTCRGAQNKHLPPWFVDAPRTFHLGLFAGLIDTDSSISLNQGPARKKSPQWAISYSTSSEELAENVCTLATLLRIKSNISANKAKEAWVVTFSVPDIAAISSELVLYNPNKKDAFAQLLQAYNPDSPHNHRWDVLPLPADVAAVLGQHVGCCALRHTPEKKQQGRVYDYIASAKRTGRITRYGFKTVWKHLGQNTMHQLCPAPWLALVTNENLYWDFITKVTPIEGKHTAWDLNVPGTNTFMTSNQVLVYDTVQIHVPVGKDAVEDVKRMTLSNQLFGDKNNRDLMVLPQHEAVLGIYTASQAKAGPARTFKTQQEALDAYRRGEIGASDPIDIK